MPRFDSAKLPRATAWRFAYLIAQGGLSLLLFSVLAHVLPARAFAATAIAQGVLVIAQAVGDFGLSQAAVTALPALLAERPADEPVLLRGAAVLYARAAALAVVVAGVAVAAVPADARLPVALIAPAAAVTVFVSGADGLLRARGEFRRPAVFVTVSRLGGFAGVASALATSSAAGACAGIAAGTVLLSLPAVRVLRQAAGHARRGDSRELLRAAVPLGCAQLFVVASGRLDTVLLGALSGAAVGGGFEGAWRVYQLSQYVVGGLASAAAPFVSDAIGGARRAEALVIVRRIGLLVGAAGLLLGAGTLVFARPVCDVLFGHPLAAAVSRALPPLAVVTPLTFLALFATVLLAISPHTRWWIVPANALGAAVNVSLIVAIARHGDLRRDTLACALGLTVTSVILLARFAGMLGGLRRAAGERPEDAALELPLTVAQGS